MALVVHGDSKFHLHKFMDFPLGFSSSPVMLEVHTGPSLKLGVSVKDPFSGIPESNDALPPSYHWTYFHCSSGRSIFCCCFEAVDTRTKGA